MFKTIKDKLFSRGNLKITLAAISMIIIIAAVFFISGASVKRDGPIIFNEIVSGNSKPIENGGTVSPDWIELYNSSNEDIDLTGYRLCDSGKSGGTEINNAVIKKGGFILVYASRNGLANDNDTCFANFGISSAGETLYLLNPDNAIAAELAVPALYTDVSYARKEDGDYGFCMEPTPGSENSGKIMSGDELKTMLGSGTLILSEALPKAAGEASWAEVYNSGSSDVYLGNYCLTNNENDKTKWHFPGQMLKPGEYAVVNLSGPVEGEAGINASFKLNSADTSVYLYDVTGNLSGSLSWDKDIPGGISVTGDRCYTVYPTKGGKNSEDTFSSSAVNSMDNSDPVRINEVLPKNEYSVCDADGDRCEWAEIYNSGGKSVSLKGYFLSDDENDLLKWAFPDITIEPKSYRIIFLSGKQKTGGELHASFKLSEGEPIYLINVKGLRSDHLPIPEAIGGNISVGRDENGKPQYYAYPTPGNKNAKGFEDPSMIGFFDIKGVYISEVCAANKAKSRKNDWIELYNGSDNDVDLSGYYLSDDRDNPQKWRIAFASIKSKGYAVIEASADNKKNTACFGISPSGEVLLLSDKLGQLLDVFNTGMLEPGITSGRVEGDNSIKRVFFKKATRGNINSKEYCGGYAQTPVFSDAGLYHKETFSLRMTCASDNAKIFYTTDGSVPTEKSNTYTGPIVISKNTVVRAAAYLEGLLPSEIKTATYLFGAPHTVPVFCITGNPSQMKYLTNTDKRSKPEYPAYVEYYEADGTLGVSFPSGVRPKGRQSLENAQNSLTIKLRSDYGQKSVKYPFFPGSGITVYSALTLRNSGQDNAVAHMRDSYFQRVAKGLNLDAIDTKLAVAYVNGRYYGLFDLDEEQNSDYIASHYGLDPSNIDMIDRNGTVINGSKAEFKRIMKMARTLDTSKDKNFADFSKYVDVDACTDYLIARIYFGDGDVINQRFWRARDYSVKWRPLLFDLDWSFRFNNASRNKFSRYFTSSARAGNGSRTDMYIFKALKKNRAWRNKFVERFIELAETQFSTKRLLSVFDETVNAMKPEMKLQIKRFHAPRSMGYWNKQTAALRNALKRRHSIALKQLQKYFRVSDKTMEKYIEKYSSKPQ